MKWRIVASWLLLQVSVTAEPLPEAPAQALRWTGSIYEKGDAFELTATIKAAQVDLRWDGFTTEGDYDFLHDRELPVPKRLQADYRFTDPGTVQAFRTLVALARLCDPGSSGALGQGLSMDAVVESPLGKPVYRMKFFATPADFVKAQRFQQIPHLAKRLARSHAPGLVPENESLPIYLRELAANLGRFNTCHRKLLEAYRTGADLPLKELEGLRVPIPLVKAMQSRNETGSAELSATALANADVLLRSCLGPSYRSNFAADGTGDGGVIFAVSGMAVETEREYISIPTESLSARFSEREYSVSHLSKDLEDVLIEFLADPALKDRAREYGFIAPTIYELDLSATGSLSVRLSAHGKRWASLDHLDLGFEASLKDAELITRLDYLNSKGIVRFLLGRDVEATKPPALIRISSLIFDKDKQGAAKLKFTKEGRSRVATIHPAEGKWVPGKIEDGEN